MLDSFTGELILKTGERLPFTFIPIEGYQPAGGRPGTVPGIGPFVQGVADFPAEWVASDGRIVLGGFVRFTGAQPGGFTIGVPELIYRFTVSGGVKASIDTGVDAPQAGSNDWTGGDALEVYFAGRTNNAASATITNVTFNNDAGPNYDDDAIGDAAGLFASSVVAQNQLRLTVHGAGGTASYATSATLIVPAYANTTFFKAGVLNSGTPDGTAANQRVGFSSWGWRNTAAITRLKWAAGGADSFVIGTELLVYKRHAS
jgi:hypothetical protein